jgi:hypothetical protein
MKIYKSYSQIPEFKGLSKWEVYKVSRVYYLKSFLHWAHWIAFGLVITCIMIWYWVVEYMLPYIFHLRTPETISLLLLIFWSAIGGFLYGQIITHTIRYLYCRDQKIKTD